MKLLILDVKANIGELAPPWQICPVGSLEEIEQIVTKDHDARVVLCKAKDGHRLPRETSWIQFGGSASEALANGARAWIKEPLVVDELRMVLRGFDDLLDLKSVLHEVDDSFVVLDSEWRYLYANQKAMAFSTEDKPDLIGRTVWEVFPEVVGSDMEEKLLEAMSTRQPRHFRRLSEFRHRMYEHRLYPVPQGLAVITSDVTELHRAEEAARESEQQLRRLTEILPQMVWTTDEAGEVNYLNRHWSEYSGLPRESSTLHERGQLVHPDDRERVVAIVEEAIRETKGYELEARLRRKDGIYRWHLSRCVPVETGSSFYWIGTSTDIDDLKRAHRALRFLAKASQILSSSLNYHETISRMVELAVPELSDWVTVDLVEKGELKQLAVAHSDPDKVNLAIELNEKYPRSPDDELGAPAVLRTGESELGELITDE